MSRRLGYGRISTLDQSAALQRNALLAAGCAEEDIYIDEGISGAKRDRPQLNAILAALQPGDTFVVWKLDRAARSLSHLLALFEDLETRGIAFASLTEGFDTGTASGRLVASILGALAEFERGLIAERTRCGLVAARLMGDRGERSRSGLRLAGRGGREQSVPVGIREAVRMAKALGDKAEDIAATYGINRATVYRIANEAA